MRISSSVLAHSYHFWSRALLSKVWMCVGEWRAANIFRLLAQDITVPWKESTVARWVGSPERRPNVCPMRAAWIIGTTSEASRAIKRSHVASTALFNLSNICTPWEAALTEPVNKLPTEQMESRSIEFVADGWKVAACTTGKTGLKRAKYNRTHRLRNSEEGREWSDGRTCSLRCRARR